ncbi:MAG: hypothetical protein RLZZ65_926 [Bacteroidota bacterium]
MKKFLLLSISLNLAFFSFSQFSIGGGASLTRFMNTTGQNMGNLSLPGINLHMEIPKSGDVTLYGRAHFLFPKANDQIINSYVTGINPNTNPYILAVNSQIKTTYFLFEGGNRYYIGNDYDNGFSGYGGSGIVFGTAKIKKDYDKYDATGQVEWAGTYQTDPTEVREGKIFTIGGFLQGGVKYTFPAVGTLFGDITGYYLLFANGSNSIASQTNYFSPLYFNFTIGFKKDLY